MNNYTNAVMVCNDTYNEFIDEISKIHPNKRKNWKTYLTDKRGVRSRVIYRPDENQFYNYSLLTKSYNKIVSEGELYKRKGADIQPLSEFGVIHKSLIDDGVENATNDLMDVFIEKNHTGNHTGRVNHTISVPTAGGQPCRS